MKACAVFCLIMMLFVSCSYSLKIKTQSNGNDLGSIDLPEGEASNLYLANLASTSSQSNSPTKIDDYEVVVDYE